ncbi:hypothetical protein J6S88_06870 [bacterium]|nr:hypothetical protein [bacterium]
MNKSTFIKLLLVASTLIAVLCFYISNHTVTFLYINPYTETAGMKNISKTILPLEKALDGARMLASDAGYKFDYVFTNGYGSGFLKSNPIPNDLDYEILIDLGTFDYNGDKTKEDIADEIVTKIQAFQYYLNSYINISEDTSFYPLHSQIGLRNSLDYHHQKYVDEIAVSLDDALSGKQYINHLTKFIEKDDRTVYYMPYVMKPGHMLLKDFDMIMLYSDLVSYYDTMPKYERIVSLTLSFCARINHDGKISYIEIAPELFSTGPLDVAKRLYAPNVFFRNSAIRYLRDLYALTDDETYLKNLLYCYADHLKVIYPEDAFEFNPIKIFKRTLQLADMAAPILGDEEYKEIHEFIYENLQNRDIQLLNEYINICDIIGRMFKSPKLYTSFIYSKKVYPLIKTLKDVLAEMEERGNIPPEDMKIFESYVQDCVFDVLKMKEFNAIEEFQKFVIDRRFRKEVMPKVSHATLKNVTDVEKMQSIINRLKNIYFDAGFRYMHIWIQDSNTFILEENEFSKNIKDFKDFAQQSDLADDMNFKVLPKKKIPKSYLRYQIWGRYNTTPEQDEYYEQIKKVLLANKHKFKINKKTYFVK